jgi:hypothetical protein
MDLSRGGVRQLSSYTECADVSQYYVEYAEKFPVMGLLFRHLFSAVPITTTKVEQSFSHLNCLGRANATVATNSASMEHANNHHGRAKGEALKKHVQSGGALKRCKGHYGRARGKRVTGAIVQEEYVLGKRKEQFAGAGKARKKRKNLRQSEYAAQASMRSKKLSSLEKKNDSILGGDTVERAKETFDARVSEISKLPDRVLTGKQILMSKKCTKDIILQFLQVHSLQGQLNLQNKKQQFINAVLNAFEEAEIQFDGTTITLEPVLPNT